MANLLQTIEIAKDFAQTSIENTVSAVERAHTAIADATYNVAAKEDSEQLRLLKEKHDKSAAQVYEAIREVNRSLGQLFSDYFESIDDSQHAATVMSENTQNTDKPTSDQDK